MSIVVNGRERPWESPVTIAELLTRLEITGPSVAVELNREIVPRARHGDVTVRDGDRIEIVTMVGGG